MNETFDTEDAGSRPNTTGCDAAFAERVAQIYRAPDLDDDQRRQFDTALRDRIEASSPWPWFKHPSNGVVWVPAAAALVILLLWQLPNLVDPPLFAEREPSPVAVAAAWEVPSQAGDSGALVASQEESLLSLAISPVTDPDESLPEDYAAIESLFFGG
jgi:hypothetical protein